MLRWAELSLASRLAGRGTRFMLAIHTEGLVNAKTARALEEFGRGTAGLFRPLMTTVTPVCPQYHVDPLLDPVRVDIGAPPALSPAVERDFEARLKSLSRFYDVGYHGHFFRAHGGRFRPAFEGEAVSSQFRDECSYLSRLGFRPTAYAGGWWFISAQLVSLLSAAGFRFDSTVNDVHADSFSRPQGVPRMKVGSPHWLADGLLEVPSVRSVATLEKILTGGRRSASFAVLALHDYDLVDGSGRGVVRRLMGTMLDRRCVLSVDDFMDEALRRLRAGHD